MRARCHDEVRNNPYASSAVDNFEAQAVGDGIFPHWTLDDKSLKAVIHNALGVCLFDKEDYKGARWEFLWVDVTYNQDKNEHAKALYFLWKIFDQLGDAERGQECREMLLNDRTFAGTEWRARAQKESKTQ